MEEGGKGLADIKIPIPSLQNKVSKKALNTPVSFEFTAAGYRLSLNVPGTGLFEFWIRLYM